MGAMTESEATRPESGPLNQPQVDVDDLRRCVHRVLRYCVSSTILTAIINCGALVRRHGRRTRLSTLFVPLYRAQGGSRVHSHVVQTWSLFNGSTWHGSGQSMAVPRGENAELRFHPSCWFQIPRRRPPQYNLLFCLCCTVCSSTLSYCCIPS